jgi:hypothetical protein
VRRLLLCIAIVAAIPATAWTRSAVERTYTIPAGDATGVTTDIAYHRGDSWLLTISGEVTRKEEGVAPLAFDPLYCFSGCTYNDHPIPSQLLRVENETEHWQGHPLRDYLGQDVPYSATHIYKVALYDREYGRLRFSIPPLNISGRKYSDSGSFTIKISANSPPPPTKKVHVVVKFDVRIKGVPNIPIANRKNGKPGLITSTLRGSGHATFTIEKQDAKGQTYLVSTETKGHFTQQDTYYSIKTPTSKLELGIVSPSTYSPETGRLRLLLKVLDSDDPACPESGLLGVPPISLATLILLPVDNAPSEGKALFFGLPTNKPGVVRPCNGHAHGWESEPDDPATLGSERVGTWINVAEVG